MAKITGKRDFLNPKTIQKISEYADASRNPEVNITSTWRSPEDQARIMFDNLTKGVRINYAAPGREIVSIFDENKHSPRAYVESLMKAKIIELTKSELKVSKHCVTKDQYNKCNIVDVSMNILNPIDFIKEALKDNNVVKIIAPYPKTIFTDSRFISDMAEPAIHLEINV